LSDALSVGQIQAALLGKPPKPFRVGRRVELNMRNGRLVRGTVTKAGKRAALLEVGWIPEWLDEHGKLQPGYPHVNIIAYAQVSRWRIPSADAPQGTWMPGHPDYAAERLRGGSG
jgi:hypothetical protein